MLSEQSPDGQPIVSSPLQAVPEFEQSSVDTIVNQPEFRQPRQWLTGGRGLLIGLLVGGAIASGIALMARPKIPSPPTVPVKVTKGTQQSVSVALVQSRQIAQTFPAQGSVEARNWVSVLPKAAGVQIKSISVKEGDAVKQGDVIAVLDNAVQQDQLAQARAQVESTQAQFVSAATQYQSSQAQVQGANAQLASAQAAVAQKQAQLAQQQATLSEAQSNQRRYVSLATQGAISTQELESRNTVAVTAKAAVNVARTDINAAIAGVQNAQAQVEQAISGMSNARAGMAQAQASKKNAIARQREVETQLGQASLVKAPASGTIAKKNANVGDLTGTTPLFSIIQNFSLELQAKVPETLLSKVRPGAPALITSDSDRRIKVQGSVREIDPIVDAKTRQALVKISLPSSELLKPGMFVRAAIAYNSIQSLTVPAAAVVAQSDGQTIVYVVGPDNVAKAKTVQVGDPAQGRIVVRSGLQSGDRVVVSGAGFVKDGDRVNVVQ